MEDTGRQEKRDEHGALEKDTEGTGVAVPRMGLREGRAAAPQRDVEPRDQGAERSGKKSVPGGGRWSSVREMMEKALLSRGHR